MLILHYISKYKTKAFALLFISSLLFSFQTAYGNDINNNSNILGPSLYSDNNQNNNPNLALNSFLEQTLVPNIYEKKLFNLNSDQLKTNIPNSETTFLKPNSKNNIVNKFLDKTKDLLPSSKTDIKNIENNNSKDNIDPIISIENSPKSLSQLEIQPELINENPDEQKQVVDNSINKNDYKEYISTAISSSLLNGFDNGNLYPRNNVKNGEVYQLLEKSKDITGIEVPDKFKKIEYPRLPYVLPTREARLEYVLGLDENKNPKFYTDENTAKAEMESIEITVWDLEKDMKTKYTKKIYITVNKRIAAETKALFEQIYNDPEQFPISYICSYDWRPPMFNGKLSEHNYGTCIDINPPQNPQIVKGIYVFEGKWEPGIHPYSIPVDGSVVRIFKSYGWTWGGMDWKNDNHDYMHFSFMGY